MMTNAVLLTLPIEDLKSLLREAVREEVKSLKLDDLPSSQKELLTRKEVSEMLGVTYSTLWNWNKKEILESRKVGDKVFYLRSEVMNLLTSKTS